MTKSIVFKWFALTAVLFFAMFLIIGIMQNFFFKRFYIDTKSDSLRTYMDTFSDIAVEKGTEAASEELYKNNHIWIAELDKYGCIRDVGAYYIEVELNNEIESILRIPMYLFEETFPNTMLMLKIGNEAIIDIVNIGGEIIPYQIQSAGTTLVNFNIANKLHGLDADESYLYLEPGMLKGTITKTELPGRTEGIPFPYVEHFFLEQVKEFQARLLAEDAQPLFNETEISVSENFVEYKIIVKPINDYNGYVFAMTSLQPVDEAISAMRKFYPYFLSLAFLCVVFLAFIISGRLAKPLLTINRITGKIAGMDFSEKLPERSADEIGQLSKSINYLSAQMESHIRRLEQDLDMERRLETTRKEFISGVSHELKTPLAVMKSCLSILRDGIAAEKTEHYLQAMENEIHRMDTLIVNMLDLAKFESGTYKPEFAPFEIDQVVDEVCQSLSVQIKEKNIVMAIELYPIKVMGYKPLISRVVANFLSNAIQHTDNGKSVSITIIRNGQEAEVSVENEGSHISDEDRKNIWQQFYRTGVQPSKRGTGLGLSISKSILELHNSSYGVENTEEGAKFFFSLPIIQ